MFKDFIINVLKLEILVHFGAAGEHFEDCKMIIYGNPLVFNL